jgi:hypothetical protein
VQFYIFPPFAFFSFFSLPPGFFFLQCGLYAEGAPLKKLKLLPEAPLPIQEFVRSAEQNFLEYKSKESLAVFGVP